MFKTMSAALIAASVFAAPVFAATSKTAEAPVIKSNQVKTTPAKAGVLNTKMSKHRTRQVHNYRHHTKIGAIKTHSKISLKHTSHTPTKRG